MTHWQQKLRRWWGLNSLSAIAILVAFGSPSLAASPQEHDQLSAKAVQACLDLVKSGAQPEETVWNAGDAPIVVKGGSLSTTSSVFKHSDGYVRVVYSKNVYDTEPDEVSLLCTASNTKTGMRTDGPRDLKAETSLIAWMASIEDKYKWVAVPNTPATHESGPITTRVHRYAICADDWHGDLHMQFDKASGDSSVLNWSFELRQAEFFMAELCTAEN